MTVPKIFENLDMVLNLMLADMGFCHAGYTKRLYKTVLIEGLEGMVPKHQ